MSKKNNISEKQFQNTLALRKITKLTEETKFPIKEAYKLARTNISFSLAQEGCKFIGVTSAYQSEGKTTTVTNIALSFAQLDKRILLIDGDMRKPQVHNVFSLDNQIGLSNILGGFAEIKDAVRKIDDKLNIITSGHIPPNPTELLSSERMKSLLIELSQDYDYIFIDTPPVNVVADTIVLCEILSGVIVVAKEGSSKHNELGETLNKLKLSKIKVLGIILTNSKNNSGKCRKYRDYSK